MRTICLDEYLDQLIRDDVFFVRASPTWFAMSWPISPGAICRLYVIAGWRAYGGNCPGRAQTAGSCTRPVVWQCKDQDAAMLELFNTALACQETARGHDDAAPGRAAARSLSRQGRRTEGRRHRDAGAVPASIECQERYQKLEDAAQAYEDYASEIYATSLPMALERRHDGRARWVALTIGNKFRTLFGSPMYGLTATITSVVLGREIEPRTVRQWLTYPAVKCPKNST